MNTETREVPITRARGEYLCVGPKGNLRQILVTVMSVQWYLRQTTGRGVSVEVEAKVGQAIGGRLTDQSQQVIWRGGRQQVSVVPQVLGDDRVLFRVIIPAEWEVSRPEELAQQSRLAEQTPRRQMSATT